MINSLLLLGDSLIEYGEWQRNLPGYKIYNFGISGETAQGLAARLPGIIGRIKQADLVVVMTGTNNLAMEDFGYMPVYEEMLRSLKIAYPEAPVAAVSLLPGDFFWLAKDAVPRMNGKLEEVCQRQGTVYLDLYTRFHDTEGNSNRSCFAEDGVHLSMHGYVIWADMLSETFLQ